MSGFSNNQIKRSRDEFEPCSNEIIAAKQSGALLLPAAVLKHYSDVNSWETYVLATGTEHTEDVFNLAANDGHRERMTDSIVRGVEGMSYVVWRTQEVCKNASTLADDSIAVLEQQLAIAREAKEKVNGVSATLLDMDKRCHPELPPIVFQTRLRGYPDQVSLAAGMPSTDGLSREELQRIINQLHLLLEHTQAALQRIDAAETDDAAGNAENEKRNATAARRP